MKISAIKNKTVAFQGNNIMRVKIVIGKEITEQIQIFTYIGPNQQRYSLSLEAGNSSIDWAQVSRFHPKTETESSL
jgi:hypothetical protein